MQRGLIPLIVILVVILAGGVIAGSIYLTKQKIVTQEPVSGVIAKSSGKDSTGEVEEPEKKIASTTKPSLPAPLLETTKATTNEIVYNVNLKLDINNPAITPTYMWDLMNDGRDIVCESKSGGYINRIDYISKGKYRRFQPNDTTTTPSQHVIFNEKSFYNFSIVDGEINSEVNYLADGNETYGYSYHLEHILKRGGNAYNEQAKCVIQQIPEEFFNTPSLAINNTSNSGKGQ